jgi:hypothetical protein
VDEKQLKIKMKEILQNRSRHKTFHAELHHGTFCEKITTERRSSKSKTVNY